MGIFTEVLFDDTLHSVENQFGFNERVMMTRQQTIIYRSDISPVASMRQ